MSGDSFDSDRLRDAEMRLIGEIGTQIKVLGENFRDFTDKLSTQMQDVRERLARIESSSGESNRQVERLNTEIDKLHDETAKIKEAHGAVVNRIVRMETIIAPITAIGAALASALVTLVAGKLF